MKRMFIALIAVSYILTGCASYSVALLPTKDVFNYPSRQVQKEVYVVADILDAKETKQIFQFQLQQKNIQPVFVVIDNRSNQTYQFSKSDINKQLLSADQAADKCKFSTIGRATTYGIAGLFIWPFLIPAVVDGVGAHQANVKIEEDYMFKEIKDDRILPNGILNGVVFVPNMKKGEDFIIRLKNFDTSEILSFSFKNE